MGNYATLAVAGGRKTQSIVEHCGLLPATRRALVVTFTHANQLQLRSRLACHLGGHHNVAVVGWYAFLLKDFARPFIPFKFSGERVKGFNFDGRPHQKATGRSRFLDLEGAAYACELGRLSHELMEASNGALLHRLECLYDELLIDEVQDLSAYDWSILDVLLKSSIEVRLVGDIRQAVLSTNPRSSKNKKYAYAEAIKWFRQREASGLLEIREDSTTWRCRPEIAAFSDAIFDARWAFPPTVSKNQKVTGHDGVFLVRRKHVADYVARYQPQCLRDSIRSGTDFDLDFMNFRVAKGTEYERVLIVPTAGISKFLQRGECLAPLAAAKFYVASTRASQSVAIVLDDAGACTLPFWRP